MSFFHDDRQRALRSKFTSTEFTACNLDDSSVSDITDSDWTWCHMCDGSPAMNHDDKMTRISFAFCTFYCDNWIEICQHTNYKDNVLGPYKFISQYNF